ncbi:type III-A CRISPR-associated protein Cas10/Csm1 [Clostridium sporogenes]|nr:type III-A CRISPR-associated protein Cas10/Csm1 [Clostridium sporogenes]NFQ42908.1 type III-A CRISPR-associated protein Cas10/Csm1 [Clostridium sporogenes]NFQ66208.1 type III-A CRISPR-associated protein Cas10/Csm1 [Clostridium sporogenes]NFT04499.1 type III-A CRISPR-associated protein Cas10/Csm1 [Clostridium sporogenes]NFT32311.1 type III-A CRISPR-associated protein Cas10/Csm1 [Clostridium sporogenes]
MLNNQDKYYRDITAAAALLHDLGKFIRRTKIDKNKHWELSYKYIKKYFKGFQCISDEQINLIAGIAALHHKAELNKTISKIKDKTRLKQLNEIKDILEDFKNRSDKTEYKIIEKIITGDLDSCSERKIFRDEDSQETKKELEIKNQQSEYSPLMGLFCTLNNILCEQESKIKYKKYFYFQPNSLVNFKNNNIELEVFSKRMPEKIKDNLNLFEKDINYLKAFRDCTFEDCINSWNFLFKKYTSLICSSKWEYLKDISLYNHIQTTAATAVSVYKEEHLKNNCGEYLIVHGRIYNIQDYIYDGINANIEKPMQRIFTRSFIISLINILIPNVLVKKIGLYTFNILFCGGGTFTVLIPDEDTIKDKSIEIMDDIKKKIGNIFNNKIYLEYEIEKIALKIDGDRTGYEKGFKVASMNLYEKKYNITVENLIYDDSKEYAKCKNCGINYIKYREQDKCLTCNLEDRWIEVSKNNDIESFYIDYNNVNLDDIKDPIKFTKSEIKEGTPIICFSYDEAEKIKEKYPIIDVYDIGKTYINKTYNKCEVCYGKDICDGPLKNNGEDNTELISLDCFSHMSKNDTIIATAKVDVDDFQFLLYHVYPRKIMSEVYNFSISRLANTSSFFNLFFSMHLKRVLEENFKDSVMVLYAGGDDIMITGNWEKVVDAVLIIKEEMKKITGADKEENTDNITITSGILFHSSKRPFNLVVKEVGSLLDNGKNCGKNCVNLNGNILTFKELQEVLNVSNDLVNDKLRKNIINRSLLFKMNKLIKMLSSNDDIEKMRAYAIYNYLINSEIKEKEFDEDYKKNNQIKNEIIKKLESIIMKDKPKHNKEYKYAREKAIIEFAIRKSRERINSNE